MNIKILDSHLINQIAAGEVIERPSSVVKELLENSLDAGATEINLEIEGGGVKLIRLRDNGSGIAKEDLRLALSRHATSKIQTIDDLEHVASLGFRGEALSSICSVSRFKLTSKVADATAGWQITAEGANQELELEPSSHPFGTSIEVRDLFFNLPVRRKFLRTEQTEFNHISEMVGRLALSRFDVEFLLKHNSKAIWSLPVAKNPKECIKRVGEIVGKEFTQNAYAIDYGCDSLKLTGWISQPNYTRNQPDLQYLYVNGRVVRDKTLSHAIKQAYQDVIFGQRYPVVVLYLNIDPALVDVNVHPTKAEVRFRDSRLVHDFVAQGLKDSLAASSVIASQEPTYHESTQRPKPDVTNTFKQQSLSLEAAEERAIYAGMATFAKGVVASGTLPSRDFSSMDPDKCLDGKIRKIESNSYQNEEIANTELGERWSEFVNNKNENQVPPLGFALAQLHGTYILAQNQDGLVIIDAHAAHERINYEQLKNSYNSKSIPMQMMLVPISVSLNDTEMNCIEANLEALQKLGFSITRSSPKSILVRSVPVLLKDADIEQLIKDVVADLLTYDSLDSITKNSNEILATMACHSSVRANQKLSVDEMNSLLRTIEKTRSGGQCGHGRPTWVPFTLASLAKLFMR